MKKRFALFVLLALAVMLLTPLVFAQETKESVEKTETAAVEEKPLKETNPEVAKWSLIVAGAAMALASMAGAFAQSRAVETACKGIARNPGATKDIRGALIIGLVLIESLILYTLVVVFVKI
jgi:F-type H+-transporting ATPase subunit c